MRRQPEPIGYLWHIACITKVHQGEWKEKKLWRKGAIRWKSKPTQRPAAHCGAAKFRRFTRTPESSYEATEQRKILGERTIRWKSKRTRRLAAHCGAA